MNVLDLFASLKFAVCRFDKVLGIRKRTQWERNFADLASEISPNRFLANLLRPIISWFHPLPCCFDVCHCTYVEFHQGKCTCHIKEVLINVVVESFLRFEATLPAYTCFLIFCLTSLYMSCKHKMLTFTFNLVNGCYAPTANKKSDKLS